MKATGIVVEYNPFHNGHFYHVKRAKEKTNANVIIAVMSGQFLQRGEPAIVDKFSRTKMALKNGVDLVVELPFPFAVQSSRYFAKGAIDTLAHLFVDFVCFGSESGDINSFIKYIKKRKENKKVYDEAVKFALACGKSFPEANEFANQKLDLNKNIDLNLPNNILGQSYTERIMKKYPTIKPITIKRIESQYHDEMMRENISSATSIRKRLLKENCITNKINQSMPNDALHFLKKYYNDVKTWHHFEQYYPFLRFSILQQSAIQLEEIHGIDEGLQYRIKNKILTSETFEQFINNVQSKRYTISRLQRIATHILTNTKKDEIKQMYESGIQHIRLLGMNQKGREYLNQYKKQFQIPIISNLQQINNQQGNLEERVSKIYYSILPYSCQKMLFKQELRGPIIM